MGSTNDIMIIPAMLGLSALVFFIIFYMATTMEARIIASPAIASDPNAVTAFHSMTTVANRLDYIFLGLFIAFILGSIISAWFIGAHPIFMFFYLLVIFLSVAFSTLFSNVWATISGASVFGSSITAFPITNHILTYLPIYAGVIGVVVFFISFAKGFFPAGGGGEFG